jgi:uncharacterized SAM-binding protein YcdF (DUF218 family)
LRINRARMRRIASDLAAGAVLGGLTFLAARALGFWLILGWEGYEALWVFLIVGAVLYATLLRPLVWAAAGTLLLLVAVGALTPAIRRPANFFVRADAPGPVDAVAVLASELNYDALVSPDALDRLLSGIALARATAGEQGSGVPLVLTIVTRGRDPVLTSATDQRRIVDLTAGGVDVHWTAPVQSTRDEARAVAAIARAEGWTRIAVVTSPIHTRRACRTFERVGVSVRCVPAEARDFAARAMRTSSDRLRATQLTLYEFAGTVYYKLRGWI